MGSSRQEYKSGLPWPPPGDLPNPRIKPRSPALAGGVFTTEPQGIATYVTVTEYFPTMFTAVSWAGRRPEAPGGHMGGAQAEGRPGCILFSTEKEAGGVSKAFCSHRTRQPLSCWALKLGLKWGVARTTPFKLDKMPLNAAQATKWQRWPGDKRSQRGWGWGKTPPSPQESSSLASPPAPGAHPHLSPRNQEVAGASPPGAWA